MKQPLRSKRQVPILDWRFSLSRLLDGIFRRGRFAGRPDVVGTVRIRIRLSSLPAGHAKRIRASASVERIGMLLAGRDVVLVAEPNLGMKPGDVLNIPAGSSLRLHNRCRSRALIAWFTARRTPNGRISTKTIEHVDVEPAQGLRPLLVAPTNAPFYSGGDLPPMIKAAGLTLSGLRDIDLFVAALPAGKSVPMHIHRYRDEVFLILSGRGVATVGNSEHKVEAGQMLCAPASTPHGLRNSGRSALILAASHSPPHDDSDHHPVP